MCIRDRGDATQAVTCFTKMCEQGITALVGDVTTTPTLALAAESADYNMPMVLSLIHIWAGTPQQEAVPKGQEFSRIENLWPRDDSCSHLFRCVSQFSHFALLADC